MRRRLVLLAPLMLVGCSDATRAHWGAMSQPAVIELYSGGRVVASWESTGRVECTEGGICDFMDAKTGKLVRTTGDIVVRVK